MKAMILAAGRGERLRPLTDTVPKPLLRLGQQRLIEYHLYALAACGFRQIVINVAYLGALIEQTLGDGSRYGLRIDYSREQPGALDTGGGIRQALTLLGTVAPFAVINADIYTDYPFAKLRQVLTRPGADAHLVLAPNPPHHPQGDFGLQGEQITRAGNRATFTGIGVYRPELFTRQTQARFSLAKVLDDAIAEQLVYGELYQGRWYDVGTPQTFRKLGGRFE